jgi:hypothetical protein
MELPTFKNDYVHLTLKDNILHVNYTENLIITLPIAKEIVNNRIWFQLQHQHNSIAMVGQLNIKYADKKAREYLACEGAERLTAAAFFSNSLVAKTLLRIFLIVENPPIPIRLFDNEKSAVAWIQNYK